MMIKNNYISNNQGFTIVETLVAIAILMIAIAGPLTIASKGLVAAVYAHDQVIASYLAQDAMEYIKNVRDNNLIQNVSWSNGLLACTSSSPCSVDTLSGDPSNIGTSIASCTTCDLYIKDDGTGYSPNSSSAKKTQFSRKFYLTAINPDESTAFVIVDWKNGTVTNSVTLTSQLFNTIR